MSDLQRITEWSAAWDRRHNDPTKNYGIHGMEVRFVLKGPDAAAQFVIFTHWYLRHIQEDNDRRQDERFPHLLCHPMPADLGYHSTVPLYEGQTSMGACRYLDGRECYYDGSGLQAQTLYWRFVEGGEEVVWSELERWYQDVVSRGALGGRQPDGDRRGLVTEPDASLSPASGEARA